MRATLNALSTLSKSVLVEFTNAGEMFAELDKLPASQVMRRDMQNDSFFGGASWQDLAALVQQGDKDLADRSRALLAKIKAATPATVQRIRKSSPFGRAVTGAYLSSDPFPCRARVKVKTDHAPLTIAVNVTSSAMTSASDLELRGLAIAALVQKVATLRPVRLVLVGCAQCAGTDPVAWACDFPTRPVDAYRLAWLLSSQGFARGMGFACYKSAQPLYKLAGGNAPDATRESFIRWARSQDYSNNAGPNTLGADLAAHFRGDVFYIPSAGSDSASYQHMLTSPVDWINTTVAAMQA